MRLIQNPALASIAAAILFGASAPISKLLLGKIEPVPLAALLYLGSGIGLILAQCIVRLMRKSGPAEAPLSRHDIPRVIAATLAGGVAAPILLMVALRHTPAAVASLLLNFEAAATVCIAAVAFREAVGRRVWASVALITAASAALSLDLNARWGISPGAVGVLAACLLWGLDNNLTNTVSTKNPLSIVTMKGLGAGVASMALAFALGSPLPSVGVAVLALGLGFLSYGMSIVLFILGMRGLGAARASALFGTAPFAGTAISLLVFRAMPGALFVVSVPLMIVGAVVLLREAHCHEHVHLTAFHEHRHLHGDEHHDHEHPEGRIEPPEPHTHRHSHDSRKHSHPHSPDAHHRHCHE